MNEKFWSNKKVLITGHTGFKGSWLSLWLQLVGSKVIGYSLPAPTEPNLFEIAQVNRDMTSFTGDVRDFDRIKKTILEHQPEIIIHLAAQAIVRYSYDNPIETYSTNVMGTINVLEAVRQIGKTKVVIIVTSDKCYKNNEWIWGYRENDPMGGNDPYSSSKGCAELAIDAYRKSYFSQKTYADHGTAIASVRAGNVIGGGDWAKDRLIPDIMKSIMNNKPVIIRNPEAIRPWQYVLDPLNGYLMLAEWLWHCAPQFIGSWNFGPNPEDGKPVSWIVDYLTKQWGNNAKWKLDTTENPHEDNYLKLDSTKARTMLKWTPKMELTKSLELIVQWYKKYLENINMRQYMENEISSFYNL